MRNKPYLIFILLIIIYACQYSTETYKEGKLIYENHCSSCHGVNGEGLGTLYPNLYKNDFLTSSRDSIACWIRYGIGSEVGYAKPNRFSDLNMPGVSYLNAIDICNTLNYLNARFWKMEEFTLQEINQNLETCDYLKNEKKPPLMEAQEVD